MRRFLGKIFRDRQIFIRVDGRVRFLRFTRGAQVMCALLLIAADGWTVTATITMQYRGVALVEKQNMITSLDRERQRLGGELAATRAYYTNAATEISRQFVEIKRLATARGALESQLVAAQAQLGEIESQYQSARDEGNLLDHKVVALQERLRLREVSNKMLSARLTETTSALAGATTGRRQAEGLRRAKEQQLAFLQANLASTESLNQAVRDKLDGQRADLLSIAEARDLANTEIRRLTSTVAALNSDLSEAHNTNSSLRRRLAATSDSLTETHQHQVVAERRGMHLAMNVVTLERRLEQVRATQLELLRGIREKAKRNIRALESTLSQTGIPLEKLMASSMPHQAGIGGPLVTMDNQDEALSDDTFEGVVGNLELELRQWEGMQNLMANLPLTRPTKAGYVSSHFGKRRDPITGRRAVHKGVDIAAPTWTPIFATAGGTVTFAGTKPAYGKLIEIDHGYGFVTRYAHLKSILVKTGQQVTFHEKIAKMGSTGRSTGSHVHYEVLYEGNQVDPVNFFEAGRYVFKVQNIKG